MLLRRGAREVVAVDVGYGQLAWSLQSDERVRVHDRQNVRELTPELIGGAVDLVVGDLSFISLTLVLDALVGVTAPDGDLALMVKPQFEVGKDRVGKGGVVRDPALRDRGGRARRRRRPPRRGWGARMVTRSPLPGPVGQRRVLPVAAPRRGRDHRPTTSHAAVHGADGPSVAGERLGE